MNKTGHPPDVTVLTVPKETDVKRAERGSKEMVAHNVFFISKVTNVKNVRRTTTGMTVVIIVFSNY